MGRVNATLAIDPRFGVDQISHVTGYVTLEQRRIAADDVLVARLTLVRLQHNCRKQVQRVT